MTTRPAEPTPVGSDDVPTPFDPPRPWALIRSAPRTVWLIVLVHGLMLICWSVLAPTYHAVDEPNHVDAAARLHDGLGWPPPDNDVYMTPDGLSSWVASPYSRAGKPLVLNPGTLPQGEAVPRNQRVPWDQLRAHYPPPRTNPVQTQQMVQHPPLYYAVGAAVLRITPGSEHWRWDHWVGLMRLLSIAFGFLLPLVFWAAATALTRDRFAALVAALSPLAIPEMSHILSVANNDSAVTFFSSLALLGIACVLRGDRSRSTAVFLGVSVGLALFSKSLALFLLPVAVLAYVVAERRARTAGGAVPGGNPIRRLVLGPLALAMAVAFVLGGWWYAFQYVRAGSIQPGVPGLPGGFRVSGRAEFLDNLWRLMIQRFWGSLGWYEVDMPFRWAVLGTAVVLVGVVVALVRSRGLRLDAALMLLPALAVLAFVALNSYGFYRHYGRVLGIQGRYVFLGWAGVAVVLAMAVAGLRPALRRWAPVAVAVCAVAMQAMMIRHALDVWWIPPGGGLRQAWGAVTAYAIWSPMTVRVVVVLTAAAVVAAAVSLAAGARRAEPRGAA